MTQSQLNADEVRSLGYRHAEVETGRARQRERHCGSHSVGADLPCAPHGHCDESESGDEHLVPREAKRVLAGGWDLERRAAPGTCCCHHCGCDHFAFGARCSSCF